MTVSVRLEREARDQLEEIARKEKRTLSNLTRKIILEYLEAHSKEDESKGKE